MRNASTPVEAWNRFYEIADAEVDAEFYRLKAQSLEARQAGRVCPRPRRAEALRHPIPRSRLLWLGVMFGAIAVGILMLAVRR